MDRLFIGFDLCDTYTQVCVIDEETKEPMIVPLAKRDGETFGDIPTVICKCRRRDEWRIGSEAFRTALESDGIMVDKLVRLVRKNGVATLEETTYTARDLLRIFIEKTIAKVQEQYGDLPISRIVFSLRTLDRRVMECILDTTKRMGLEEEQVRIIGHAESFLFHIMSQKKELYANVASMMELSEEGLYYMECKVHRGVKPQIVQVVGEQLEEGFDVGILETPQGQRLADNIVSSCAERMLAKKIVSSVCLSGKGFGQVNKWGQKTLALLCNRRKVFYEGQLFAKGAAYLAYDLEQATTAYPYLCICDGRLASNVTMDVQMNGLSKTLTLVRAGERWYQAHSEIEFILDDRETVDLQVVSLDQKQKRVVQLELDTFPVRPNKTTRVRLTAECLSEYTLKLRLEDMGFGMLFPASGVCVEQDVPL